MKLDDLADVSVDTLWAPFTTLWAKMIDFTPKLPAVLIIMIVDYIVSAVLRRVAGVVLRRVGFDEASRCIRCGMPAPSRRGRTACACPSRGRNPRDRRARRQPGM
ncbi:MAG: hypothetical protein ABI629_04485 [bacterium]